jgi:hypothetical protein
MRVQRTGFPPLYMNSEAATAFWARTDWRHPVTLGRADIRRK